MELNFKGATERVKLVIDRKNKKLKISTSQTGYKLINAKWFYLFDKRKEKAQDKLTEKLSDKDFKMIVILSMNQRGYILIENV